MVPEGGSAKLVCKARGYPKPEIIWKREDGIDIIVRTSSGSKSKGIREINEIILYTFELNLAEMLMLYIKTMEYRIYFRRCLRC